MTTHIKYATGALVFVLGSMILLPAGIVAAVADAPENSSTFYVNVVSDGPGIPMRLLPQELGVNYAAQYFTGTMGVLVSNGVVVEETNPQNLLNTNHTRCGTIAGWACSGNFKVSGTYKNGKLDILSVSERTYGYDGTPIDQGSITLASGAIKRFARVPIVPGSVTFKSETRYECTAENASTFACSVVRTFVSEPSATCAEQKPPPYPGAYSWDICARAKYVTKPQQTETKTVKALVVPLNGMAIVSAVTGADPETIEVVRSSGKIAPARVGDVLKKGDIISTGFEGSATLDFGYASLEVWSLTRLTIDEYTSKDNITKTQLALRIGSVQAKTRHTPAIRSDFSVVTPTANASIRGSEMQVSYDEKTKETTVIALEDKAFVKGIADVNEMEIPEKKQVIVSADGKAGPLTNATATSQNSSSSSSRAWLYVLGSIVLAALIAFAIRRFASSSR